MDSLAFFPPVCNRHKLHALCLALPREPGSLSPKRPTWGSAHGEVPGMPGGFIRNPPGPHLCSTSPPGPSPHPGPCRAPGVNLCPALAAGTAGWPRGTYHVRCWAAFPMGSGAWILEPGTCGWVPSNCLAGLARTGSIGTLGVGAPAWPTPASQAPRPTAPPVSASGSGCLDTQPQVQLLMPPTCLFQRRRSGPDQEPPVPYRLAMMGVFTAW